MYFYNEILYISYISQNIWVDGISIQIRDGVELFEREGGSGIDDSGNGDWTDNLK